MTDNKLNANPDEPTDADRALLRRLLQYNPNLIEQEAPIFLPWLVSRIEVANLQVPASQVPGFAQFTVKTATEVVTEETTTSTTPTNLATTGPTITGLADGMYFVIFRATVNSTTSGEASVMSVSINSDDADTTSRFASMKSDVAFPITWWFTASLSNSNNNTLQMKYWTKNAASAARFSTRQLAAIKYQN